MEKFAAEKQTEMEQLIARREKCRNRLRRCSNPVEADRLHTDKTDLTTKITAIRRELRIVRRILPRVKAMREKIEWMTGIEQQDRADGGYER